MLPLLRPDRMLWSMFLLKAQNLTKMNKNANVSLTRGGSRNDWIAFILTARKLILYLLPQSRSQPGNQYINTRAQNEHRRIHFSSFAVWMLYDTSNNAGLYLHCLGGFIIKAADWKYSLDMFQTNIIHLETRVCRFQVVVQDRDWD